MPRRWPQALLAAALGSALCVHAQAVGATADAIAPSPAPAPSSPASAPEEWTPKRGRLALFLTDEEILARQNTVRASLPQDVQAQQAELIRLVNIPLPNEAERKRILDLTGTGFPRGDPLYQNETFLLQYYRSLPKPTKDELQALVASLKQRMIFLKGGNFIMGDFGPLKFTGENKGLGITSDTNNVARQVELDSFSIMKGRVTFGELDLYMRDTGQTILAEGNIVDAYRHRPGYMAWPVKWPLADGYCHWLAQLTGQPFRLPSEAQWEYAAREGGKFIAYPMHDYPGIVWGNAYMPTSESVDRALRTLKANAGRDVPYMTPHPTNLNGQNRIGMEGVVGGDEVEWASDWYAEDYYKHSPLKNPQGPPTGTLRVARKPAYTWTNSVLARRGREPEEGNYFRCTLDAKRAWR